MARYKRQEARCEKREARYKVKVTYEKKYKERRATRKEPSGKGQETRGNRQDHKRGERPETRSESS